ncbi:lysozyme inhibitor LprI family protein [Pseudomonas sp. QTF5]|uniref:lysozyme inhibitor LprI family protein n=1 Tax=Pseudomonas sp. QTF5 TaxID=1435425 RepID=UPI0004B8ECE8|nr:lysozyme inhibitor LprI family protein [Pseudomonas sp. QTF5]
MKSIFLALALALIASGVHATEESDDNPCDKVENEIQTLECSAYSRTAAEQLLSDNYQSLTERMQTLYGNNKAQLTDITAKIKVAQQQWLKTRDADCAVEAFPATSGSKAFTIAQNDCVARISDERSEFLESIGQE